MNAPPTTERTDPLIGAVLVDRFQIHARLGAGGFGVVYRASQLSIDRMVAVKVLGLRATGPAARGRFLREARVLSRLASPHTVRLIDFGILGDGRFFYVMEYLEGETLEDLIARGPVPVDVALRIAEQICHALQEAHGQQIVHRDLKPANIWLQQVSGDRVVRLLDFGTARLLDADEVTQSEVLIGTPAYLAPEQCRSGEVDARVDLYALGLIVFEMVTGRHPFGEGVLAEMIHHHVYTTPPALDEAVDGVPPALTALVARLLAKRPEGRPGSAWAVRLEIERLLVGRGTSRVMGLAPTAVFDVIDDAPAPGAAPRGERSTRRLERASLQAMLAAPTGATLAWSREAMPAFEPDPTVGDPEGEGAPTVRVGIDRPWVWAAGLVALLLLRMSIGWVILQWLPRRRRTPRRWS
ncbi:MAG: serine/threonine protein kinase [Myxococcales bacterium]|nr:serine/threonine protein kinase [Myxococcales bacterium]